MEKSLIRSIMTLATGSIAASIVMAISIPVLSRFFSPEEFGVFGVYLSIVGLISLFASANIESALMLTSRKNERAIILKTCTIITIASSIVTTLALSIFSNQAKIYFGTESIIPILLVIPGVIAFCGHKLITINANSNKEYGYVSKATFYRSVSIVVCQLALSFVLAGTYGLILGSILSYVLYIQYFCFNSNFKRDFKSSKITSKKAKYILQKYRRTYIHLFPQSLLNYASQQLPYLIFPLYYSTSVIGGLFIAQRLLKMPAGILTMALRNVFYPYFREQNSEGIYHTYIKLTSGLFFVGFPICIIMYYYISDLVVLVLGDNWREAGEYSKYMLFWVFMSIVNVATTPALTIISENKLLLKFEIIDFTIKTVILLYCLNSKMTAKHTIMYYSLTCGISYIAICLICTYRLHLNKHVEINA
ncbi:oligosaccharide flippase family protein [Enterovibrio sp. ZSDZ35]|uniref:Oligosaccharide flippase family protein n=1 Tax=Enterovibrio qingdaonensis TaxID=2899818 RepID=A0ABT5QN17_9GAMM|nr:oligosaccharide flippase family protein [Enterovibrio sp. ZSDZ35]MDD1782372.1 oligosaccharide flippase family protein [Enterovibrio sp. ZSDZ35]